MLIVVVVLSIAKNGVESNLIVVERLRPVHDCN
jgi:hypothetical protein